MRILLAPYNMRVSAARHLARMLGGQRILPVGSRYRPRPDDVVVNWGRSDLPATREWRVLNHPGSVAAAIDKLQAWRNFAAHGVPTVEWARERHTAEGWQGSGNVVLFRSTLTGRGGQGIEICQPDEVLPETRGIFVKYFRRRHEYRVHVFDGQVIDVQQKKRRRGSGECNNYVRSYDNGWVFCREDVVVPDVVKDASIRAAQALGLTFGGVDVGYNQARNMACVFEVNSAPGIEGSTLDSYAEAIRRIAA